MVIDSWGHASELMPAMNQEISDSKEEKQLNECLIDFLASFISTNRISLDYGYKTALALFEREGIGLSLKEGVLLCPSGKDLASMLRKYDLPRGERVSEMIGERIENAFTQINKDKGGVLFLTKIANATYAETQALLLPIYGVGPVFVDSFLALRGFEEPMKVRSFT